MRRLLPAIATLGMIAFSSLAAHANTFTFSYTGVGLAGSGILTTTNTPVAGDYTITGISGTSDGATITMLYAAGVFQSSDNLLSATPPFLDFNGFSYLAGGIGHNLYYDGASYRECAGAGCNGNPANDPKLSFSVTPSGVAVTPEPSSLALLGTGILGIWGMARRKRAA